MSINSKVDLDRPWRDRQRDGDSSQQMLNVTVIRLMYDGRIAVHKFVVVIQQYIYLSVILSQTDRQRDE